MKGKSLSVFCGILLSCLVLKAETGKVLLRINGQEVFVSEFERYYRRAAAAVRMTPEEYFPVFVAFKLKAADARRLRMDTLPWFKDRYRRLRAELSERIFVDGQVMETVCRSIYRNQTKRFSATEEVKMEEIAVRLPQRATRAEIERCRRTMDSLYTVLRHEASSFSVLAKKYSAGQKNHLGWLPLRILPDETVAQLRSLKKGSFSKPFFSPLGMHIVRLDDWREKGSFEEAYPLVRQYVERELGRYSVVDSVMQGRWMSGCLDETPALRQLSDGLLAVCWEKANQVSVVPSSSELQAFFRSHKDDYAWEFPHFKGGIVHCLSKKAASKLKKRLKKLPVSAWEEEVRKLSAEKPELRARVETGLYQIGKNKYVDKLAFKCGGFTPLPDYPYTFVLGKRLKKGPEEYEDVKAEVMYDFFRQEESRKLAVLQRVFTVETDESVLKTVNCIGNN